MKRFQPIHPSRSLAAALCLATALPHAARLCAGDWPMWGGTPSRNMVSSETDLPHQIHPGTFKKDSEEIELATAKNVLWSAKLGSQSYGNPTVVNGRVYVGTNNESPRDSEKTGDRSVLMCFEEKTGRFLWQLAAPKLGAGKVSDWEFIGLCSSPAVEGDRVYVVSNRCEVLCLDAQGLANGNQGPFVKEAEYLAQPGGPPAGLKETDADILWAFDMRNELGVFPHNISSCSPLIAGDRVFVATSNGVDWSHSNIPAPLAPSLVAIDKNSGLLAGEEASGVSKRTLHCSWSSPALGAADGQPLIVWGGGDGWAYGFDPQPEKDAEGILIFRERWRFDCNPPEYRARNGEPIKYATPSGPSEVIGTAVVVEAHAYLTVGQDPEHGDGVGALSCLDITKSGDISKTGARWIYKDLGRSMSTVSVSDNLVYCGEYAGKVHCIDAVSGKPVWVHETNSRMWGSTLVADGKVHFGNEDGDLVILKAGRKKQLVNKINLLAPVYSTPVAANGVLFVATQTHLWAIGNSQRP